MTYNLLNNQAIDVFIIIAETLKKWKNPSSEDGKTILHEHYNWGAELKSKNKLILAGSTDFDLISTNEINPIGLTTGIIMLNVSSREEAIEWAENDPFHLNEFRRNVVHSFKISMTEKIIFKSLQKIKENQ